MVLQQENGELQEDLTVLRDAADPVDEQGDDSFPASDPPTGWAGSDAPIEPKSHEADRVISVHMVEHPGSDQDDRTPQTLDRGLSHPVPGRIEGTSSEVD